MAIGLHRNVRDTSDFSTQQRDRIAPLLPRFQQVVSLAKTMMASRSTDALLHCRLDRWPCGLLVCDSSGNVQWLNQRARTQPNAGKGLVPREGVLKAAGVGSQERLTGALLAQACSTTSGVLAIHSGDQGWHLALQALDPRGGNGQQQSILITLTDNYPAGHISPEALAALFELTGAEAKLTSALVAGTSLEQYALLRGVTWKLHAIN